MRFSLHAFLREGTTFNSVLVFSDITSGMTLLVVVQRMLASFFSNSFKSLFNFVEKKKTRVADFCCNRKKKENEFNSLFF